MAINIIFVGILICSIIFTFVHIKLENKKEMNDLIELFEDMPSN
jgi:hypothetical protein